MTAIAAPAWGTVTLLLFVPLGALFVVSFGEGFCVPHVTEMRPCHVPRALHLGLALAALAVTISGFWLAIRLVRDSITLPAAGPHEQRHSRITAMAGVVHHAAVLGWASACLGPHDQLETLPWIAIPCAIGMLFALVQWRASAHVARAVAVEAERSEAAA